MSKRVHKTAHRGLASAVALSIAVTACVPQTPLVVSAAGAGDAGQDVCYREHQALGTANDFFTEEVVTGAAIGAVLGGLTGALTGGSHAGRNALIGAAAGAVVGGTGGYLAAKQRENADRAALLASVHGDLVRESEEIDRATIAFAKARDCRIAAAERIKADHKAGRLSRPEAQARLDRLRQQHDDDIALAEAVSVNMAKRAETFRTAGKELTGMEPEAPVMLQALVRDAKVRAKRDRKSASIASLSKGALVEVVGSPDAAGWIEVSLNQGRTGFLSREDFEAKPPQPKPVVARDAPVSDTGIVQLTSSNQVKQAGFAQTLQQAKADTPLFDLSAG